MKEDIIKPDINILSDRQLKDCYESVHSEIFLNYQRINISHRDYFNGVFNSVQTAIKIKTAKLEIHRYSKKLAIIECERIKRSVNNE